MRTVSVAIINDDQYEADVEFYVILKNPVGAIGIGDPSVVRVMVIDDDEPGEFGFSDLSYTAAEGDSAITATVIRQKGSDGTVEIHYFTVDGSAKGGEESLVGLDYLSKHGVLQFKHGETSKLITVTINRDLPDHEKMYKNFMIALRNPSLGAKIGEHGAAVCHLAPDVLGERLANMRFSKEEDTGSWGIQFFSAMTVGGDRDEEGNEILPSRAEYILHFLSFLWKVLLAFIPPRKYLGSWPAFVVSLLFIGMETAIVEQLGHLLGCVIGLKNSVTGITLIALGTSLPDTFASRTAAMQDKFADASIGNIMGSNSVNVFLGLGLPWVLSAMYHYARGERLVVPTQSLELSVSVFTGVGFMCILTLLLRRKVLGGELGGPWAFKMLSGVILFGLWLSYLVLSALGAYGFILGENVT